MYLRLQRYLQQSQMLFILPLERTPPYDTFLFSHSWARLASKCLQEDPSKRCRMGDVVHDLGPLYFHSRPGQPLPRGLPPSTCPSSPEPTPLRGSTIARVKSVNSDVAHGPSPTPPLPPKKLAHVHLEKLVAQIYILDSTPAYNTI